MKTVLISEFKAKCIKMLKEVQKNGKPLTVTLRGEPIARVEPIAKQPKRVRLAALKGRIEIKGTLSVPTWIRTGWNSEVAARHACVALESGGGRDLDVRREPLRGPEAAAFCFLRANTATERRGYRHSD